MSAGAAEGLRKAMASGRRSNDPEREIWSGGFSSKALMGWWVTSAALSIVALVLIVVVRKGWPFWLALGVVPWLATSLFLAYKRLSVSYRLTSQRFFHEKGLFSRTVDRIEVIDMDDVQFRQGIIDRLMGTGVLRIKSSDISDPWLEIRGIEEVRDVAQKIDAARREERIKRGLHIETV